MLADLRLRTLWLTQPHSSEKELYLYYYQEGQWGRDIFPRFLDRQRERHKSAPWRQELPRAFSYTDAKNRPCGTGYGVGKQE